MSNIKNEVKLLLIHADVSMTDLVQLLNNKHNRNDTVQNLNNKLARGTIKYNEIKEIAEILDYRLAWIPQEYNFSTGATDRVFFSTSTDESKHKQKGKPFIANPITSQKRLERSRNAINRDSDLKHIVEESQQYNADDKSDNS